VGDFDNDGDTDIALLQKKAGVNILFWMNDGDGTFTSQRFLSADVVGIGNRIISGDFNNDGWLDFMVSTGEKSHSPEVGQYAMYHATPGLNDWLSIDLAGVTAEKNVVGARVWVTTSDGRVQVQEQDSAVHGPVQDSARLHFGLGQSTVDSVRIVWAEGHMQVHSDIGANQHVTIVEQRGTLVVKRDGNLVSVRALGNEACDLVTLPGTISTTDGRIRDLVTVDLEGNDVVAQEGHFLISLNLRMRDDADSFQFRLEPDAELTVRGDFDIIYL
jgi:hypothetical protein